VGGGLLGVGWGGVRVGLGTVGSRARGRHDLGTWSLGEQDRRLRLGGWSLEIGIHFFTESIKCLLHP